MPCFWQKRNHHAFSLKNLIFKLFERLFASNSFGEYGFFPELEPFAELASSSAMRGGVSLQLDSASSQRGQGQRPQYKTKRKTKSKRKA